MRGAAGTPTSETVVFSVFVLHTRHTVPAGIDFTCDTSGRLRCHIAMALFLVVGIEQPGGLAHDSLLEVAIAVELGHEGIIALFLPLAENGLYLQIVLDDGV